MNEIENIWDSKLDEKTTSIKHVLDKTHLITGDNQLLDLYFIGNTYNSTVYLKPLNNINPPQVFLPWFIVVGASCTPSSF